MQSFLQVKHVIDYSKMTHIHLRDFYASLNKKPQPERVKMLLNHLIEDQRRIEKILSTFEAVSEAYILDSWMQYVSNVDIHGLINNQKIKADISLDEITELAVKFGEVLVNFYREAATKTDLEKVSNIFKNLAEMEVKDNLKQARAALFEEM